MFLSVFRWLASDNLSCVNHRLRGAMLSAGLSATELASAAGVDPKSVSRWLCEDRVPQTQTRHKVAEALGQHATFLWPELLNGFATEESALTELARVWATRTAVSADTWHGYFNRAAQQIDILVYAGGFLVEALDLVDIIRWKTASGVRVRMLVGDPDSSAVHNRAQEERVCWLPERCRTMARYLASLDGVSAPQSEYMAPPSTQASFGSTGSCSSISTPTGRGRVIHRSLRSFAQAGTRLFDHYSSAYERVWAISQPAST